MNGDDVNVPPQRTDQQVRDSRDDEHASYQDTGQGVHRDPYGRNDDILVASHRTGTAGDTGPHPAPGDPDDARHDTYDGTPHDPDSTHHDLDTPRDEHDVDATRTDDDLRDGNDVRPGTDLRDDGSRADHDLRTDNDLQDNDLRDDHLRDNDLQDNDLRTDDDLRDGTVDPAHGPGDVRQDSVTPVEPVTGVESAPPVEETPSHAAPPVFTLFDRDPAEVQSRWRDVQASFVDDPSEAVQRADGLVGEIVESITSTLQSRTDELRDSWKSDGGSDTERLRQALREYRSVLEGLLTLSGPASHQPASGTHETK
ncbi:hypothetical protein [Nonomuraea sp. NPDC048826]|uniref:hypothetical protein n=1 Tax=Nonomuraea sp. NPDC048826 TaxID=3364347 RepID=UPI00371CA768